MLQVISDVVKNVAIIILLTTFLEMLLPNSNMQRFIKVVMGLFIMLAILNPVIGVFSKDYQLSAWQLSSLPGQKVETVLAQGEKLGKVQEEQALVEYKIRIEKQIEALIKLIPGIALVKCTVSIDPIQKLGAIAKIDKVIVEATLGEEPIVDTETIKPVEPIKVDLGAKDSPIDKDNQESVINPVIKEKILNIIINYYSLQKENIKIIIH